MTKLFYHDSEDFSEIRAGYLPSQSKLIWQHRTRIAWATRLAHHKNTGRKKNQTHRTRKYAAYPWHQEISAFHILRYQRDKSAPNLSFSSSKNLLLQTCSYGGTQPLTSWSRQNTAHLIVDSLFHSPYTAQIKYGLQHQMISEVLSYSFVFAKAFNFFCNNLLSVTL